MRATVLPTALALAIVGGTAGCAKPHTNVQAVRVNVFSDHYEIDGQSYHGPLSAQLDKYAHSSQRISIVLNGSNADVQARLPELARLSGNSNVSVAVVTMRVVD
jgi:hypothetical protein